MLVIKVIVVVLLTCGSETSSTPSHENSPGSPRPDPILTQREKNKMKERDRQMMSVLSVVSRKRNVNNYAGHFLLHLKSNNNSNNSSNNNNNNNDSNNISSPHDGDVANLEEDKKFNSLGSKIINITGTRMNQDEIEFNVPDLSGLKKVTSVVLRVMVKSRKSSRKSMEKVEVKVYAPEQFSDLKGDSYVGMTRIHGKNHRIPKSPTPASEKFQDRKISDPQLKLKLKLISEIKIEPNKTKWATIPISSWYVQDIIDNNVTRLNFVIHCDQCKGIGRKKRHMKNEIRRRAEKPIRKRNSSSARTKAPSATSADDINNDNNSHNIKLRKKTNKRNARHSKEETPEQQHQQHQQQHQQKHQQQQHQHQLQQHQYHSRNHNYLPQLLIYTKDK